MKRKQLYFYGHKPKPLGSGEATRGQRHAADVPVRAAERMVARPATRQAAYQVALNQMREDLRLAEAQIDEHVDALMTLRAQIKVHEREKEAAVTQHGLLMGGLDWLRYMAGENVEFGQVEETQPYMPVREQAAALTVRRPIEVLIDPTAETLEESLSPLFASESPVSSDELREQYPTDVFYLDHVGEGLDPVPAFGSGEIHGSGTSLHIVQRGASHG